MARFLEPRLAYSHNRAGAPSRKSPLWAA